MKKINLFVFYIISIIFCFVLTPINVQAKQTYIDDCTIEKDIYTQINDAINLVNQIRLDNGKCELLFDEKLENCAKIRAKEISKKFSHTRPNNKKWYSINSKIMYGENLARNYQTAEDVVNAWMNSPTHADNILFDDFRTIAIAIYNVNGEYYWVQEFGY